MKHKVRVTHTVERDVPIYKYDEDQKRTDELLRIDRTSRTFVLFSGSYDAYQIWRAGHWVPPAAEVKENFIKE